MKILLDRSQAMHRTLASCVAVLALVAVTGCHKKAAPPPPPPPPAVTGTAPTATLTAAPPAINPGESATLTWHTTDATDVSIDGLGAVPSSGTKSVSPTQSTDYHLIARGLGGSTDATARVTVNAGAASSTADNSGEQMDDATFHSNVQDIFFDYDSYDVNGPAQATVSKDAGFLASHPRLKIVIGGYCDERGSTEYNLALGENRANAVKQALVTAGVNPDRIRTVSYGKEKQFCTEHNEQCYQQNRRAGFSVDR